MVHAEKAHITYSLIGQSSFVWSNQPYMIGERDTYRGNTIENRGCLFIYFYIIMFGRTYVFLYFDPPYFCVRSAFDPVPNFTKQNPPV